MISRFAAAVALLLTATTTASAQQLRGSWTADATEREAGKMHVQLSRKHSNTGQTMRVDAFTGLSEAQIRSATQVPVQFALNREAGTVAFEGSFKQGLGAGQFEFTPNPAYLDTLRSLGISTESRKSKHMGERADERLLHLALHDVSTSFIASMQAAGYNVSLDDYLAFRIFRVSPELVRELRTLGFDNLSADDLVGSQIHRVTPQYIREMAAAGFKGLTMKQLMASGIHGVTPEFVRELRELGYTNVSADNLVAMRIHRVTPEFIRELKAAGYSNVPVEKLISMRIHGIDAEFVKKMNRM